MDKIWTTINNSDERKKREEKKRKDLFAIFTPPPDPRQLSHPIFHSHNSEDSRRAIPSGTPSLKTEERERKTVEGRKGPFEKSSLVTRSSCAAEKRFSLVLHSPRPREVLSASISIPKRGEMEGWSAQGLGKAFALEGWRRPRWHRDSAPSPIKMFFKQASF